jgi:hypothetical protein
MGMTTRHSKRQFGADGVRPLSESQHKSSLLLSRLLAAGVAGLLAASLLGAAPAVAGPAPAWSVVPSPNATAAQDQLMAVSCPAATMCIAVGISNSRPLAERWNGTTWATQRVPSPPGATSGSLNGVSCTSATACFAVGGYANSSVSGTLAEFWNGKTWAVQQIPSPTGGQGAALAGISCTSATACVAVGENRPFGEQLPAATEIWNGKTWVIQDAAVPVDSQGSIVLSAVSCASATACVAVGGYDARDDEGTEPSTLAEHWDGEQWAVQVMPELDLASLAAVSCTSATACTAVGTSEVNGLLAEHWDGEQWTVQATPEPGEGLTGIACTSATACSAVGTNGLGAVLAEAWNGKTWSSQPIRNRLGATLLAISCASVRTCATVGSHVDEARDQLTLAERWNGASWAVQPTFSSHAATAQPNSLAGLTCTSARACMAVGTFGGLASPFAAVGALAEAWNGRRWAIRRPRNPAGTLNVTLAGVSCTSARACTAVGGYVNSRSLEGLTLAERWNGRRWAIQFPRNPVPYSEHFNSLAGVSCVSATACTAVGSFTVQSEAARPLAEHWNGRKWAIRRPLNPAGASDSSLAGVSCTSAAACTAVGQYTKARTEFPLAERWNGKRWARQPTPSLPGAQLLGVSCTSARTCTAVGATAHGTLAVRWNGKRWARQRAPSLPGAQLVGVSCTSARACAAVGYTNPPFGVPGTLAEAWNGRGWVVQPTSTLVGASLAAVSCTSARVCTAVGENGEGAGFERTLIERR